MQALQGFFLHRCVNSTSVLERAADKFLWPLRYVADNREWVCERTHQNHDYVYLKNDEGSIRFTLYDIRRVSSYCFKPTLCSRTKVFVARLFVSLLIPLGLIIGTLLKGLALCNKDVRDHLSNWKKPVMYFNCPEIENGIENLYATVLHIAKAIPNISELWTLIKEKHLTSNFIKSFAQHPDFYYSMILICHRMQPGTIGLPMLELWECGCHSARHSRYHNHLRQNFENDIVAELNQLYPDKQHVTPTLLSVGPGHLFQDFVVIAKLINEGFTTINLHLIEPDQKQHKDQIKNFTELCDELRKNNIQINVTWHDKVDEEVRKLQFDEVYAIDFTAVHYKDNTGWQDLVDVRRQLRPEGNLYFTDAHNVLKLDPSGKPKPVVDTFDFELVVEKYRFFDQAIMPAVANLNREQEIRIGEFTDQQVMQDVFTYVDELIRRGFKTITIDVVRKEKEPKHEGIIQFLHDMYDGTGVKLTLNWVDQLSPEKGHYHAIRYVDIENVSDFSLDQEKPVIQALKDSLNPGSRLYYLRPTVGRVAWEATNRGGRICYSDFSEERDWWGARRNGRTLFEG